MKKIVIPFLLLVTAQIAAAQEIIYADVQKADIQKMNFEILGKIANNYLVYKELKGKNRISVYDENMRMLEEVPVNLPKRDNLLDLSFSSGNRHSNLIYQFQDGNVVYLMASKAEANGRILNEPVVLDTTMIAYKTESKIYNTLSSADGNRVMVFKINRKNRNLYHFTSRLYDNDMTLLNEEHYNLPMEDASYRLGSYNLTNEGNLVFTKYSRLKSGNIAEAKLIEKSPGSADFKFFDLTTIMGMGQLFLDDIKLKIDEPNQRYILASLYSNTAKGGMDGIYVSAFDKKNGQRLFERTSVFDDDLRKRAKSSGSLKSVFNDYFINNIILNSDGGFTVASEALYTSGGDTWDRWGYWGSSLYGPWGGWGGGWGYWSPYRFYSPFFYRSYWWGGWGPWGGVDYYGNGWSRYHADNVAIISFDSDGNKTWDNVIVKRQDDTETDGSISYQVLSKGDNMHFLLNNSGKISSLEDITISQSGSMRENEAVNAKDKNIDFMPRYAKQVGPGELIVPYRYKNNISFAKVSM